MEEWRTDYLKAIGNLIDASHCLDDLNIKIKRLKGAIDFDEDALDKYILKGNVHNKKLMEKFEVIETSDISHKVYDLLSKTAIYFSHQYEKMQMIQEIMGFDDKNFDRFIILVQEKHYKKLIKLAKVLDLKVNPSFLALNAKNIIDNYISEKNQNTSSSS